VAQAGANGGYTMATKTRGPSPEVRTVFLSLGLALNEFTNLYVQGC